MKGRALLGAALTSVLALVTEPALAHPPPLGIPGFFGGLLHPLFVPAHVLAIGGLALLIGTQSAWSRAAPFGYIAALAGGLAVMTLGVVPRGMTETLLVSAAITGVLVAWAKPLPEAIGVVIAIVTAFVIALDSPPEVIALREANFMLIGTGFGATIALILFVECASRLERPWLRIGARVLGSWVAAGALLALALAFAR